MHGLDEFWTLKPVGTTCGLFLSVPNVTVTNVTAVHPGN